MSRPFIIVPLTGQISMTDIDNAFHLGTDMQSYKGKLYYKPSVDNTPRYFPSTNLDMGMFHGTWPVLPPQKISFGPGDHGNFVMPAINNFIIVHVWGAGGAAAQGGGGGGAFRQFNYSLDGRANFPTFVYGDSYPYSVGTAGDSTAGRTNSHWNNKLVGGGADCSPGDQYGGGGGGWNSQGGPINGSGWWQQPGQPQIGQSGANGPYNGASCRGSGYYDGNLSPFGGGGGENGNPVRSGPGGGFSVFGGGGGALDYGGSSKYGGAGLGRGRNGGSLHGGGVGQIPGGSGAGGRIDIYIDLVPPFDATADLITYGAPPNQDAPTSGGPWQNDSYNPGIQQIPSPPPEPGGGSGGGSCFVKGSLVTLESGIKIAIENIKIGDRLKGHTTINTVVDFDHQMLDNGNRQPNLYGINSIGRLMTSEHPIMTKAGWKSVDPSETSRLEPQIANIIIGKLEINDSILLEDNSYLDIDSIEQYDNQPQQLVYNFKLNGDHTYYVNGILAHNKGSE